MTNPPSEIVRGGDGVAADATDDGLFLDLGRLEVAEVTGGRSDGDVAPLDDLRVAARAAQLLALPQLAEVVGVIEPDPEIIDLSLQQPLRVAAGAQAGRVVDLRPGS